LCRRNSYADVVACDDRSQEPIGWAIMQLCKRESCRDDRRARMTARGSVAIIDIKRTTRGDITVYGSRHARARAAQPDWRVAHSKDW
jgi:hypothetical protein